METWKPIKDYVGSYEVSNTGKVRSLDRYTKTWNGEVFKKGVIKTLKEDKDGYHKVWLSRNSKKKPFFVHRLVARAFIENTSKLPVVNHIDGDKKNNNVTNLEWCTISQKTKHAFDIGLRKANDGGMSRAVFSISEADGSFKAYRSISDAARKTGISIQTISYCVNGRQRKARGFYWAFLKEGVTTIREE